MVPFRNSPKLLLHLHLLLRLRLRLLLLLPKLHLHLPKLHLHLPKLHLHLHLHLLKHLRYTRALQQKLTILRQPLLQPRRPNPHLLP